MKSNRAKSELFLLLCTLIWGGTFTVLKFGLEDTSPFFLIFARFAFASVLFLPFFNLSEITTLSGYAGRSRNALVFVRSIAFQPGAILGIVMFVSFSLQTAGLETTTASRSAFITQMLILFIPGISRMVSKFTGVTAGSKSGSVFGIAYRVIQWSSIVLILAGLFMLTTPENGDISYGDILTLGCALSFALYIVLVDYYTMQYSYNSLLFPQTVVTALLSFIAWFILEKDADLDYSFSLFASIVYLAPLGTNLTVFWQTKYQKNSTPMRASAIYTMEPVFATVIATIVIGESMNAREIAGGVVAIAGMLLFVLREKYYHAADTLPGA